jgi:hypothetical protein
MLVAGISLLLTRLAVAFVAMGTWAASSAFYRVRALHSSGMEGREERKETLRFGGEDKEISIKQ